MQSIQKLYDRCAAMGMTPTGWKTLCNQLGAVDGNAIEPKQAQSILPKLSVEKIMMLNSGKRTAPPKTQPTPTR